MIFYDTSDLKNDEIYLSLTATGEAIPEDTWVPGYTFDICLSDGTKVGLCNFKIDNSELTEYCGNIGYSIFEQYRGNKYSLKASKLLLKLAQKYDLQYVLISCLPDSKVSNKICRLLNTKCIKSADTPHNYEIFIENKNLNICKMDI